MARQSPMPTLGPALGQRLVAELDRAGSLLGRRGGRLHDGVHQARKSLRRARAILALAGVHGRARALIDDGLRAVCDSLSALRDAQALVETLDRMLADPGQTASRPLLRRARRVAAQARAEALKTALADDPGLTDRRGLLAVLAAGATVLDWSACQEDHIVAALAVGADQVERAAWRAQARGEDLDWHRWRRRVRRLKQQHTVLAALGHHVEGEAFAGPVERLADTLGQAQDFALLAEHCGKRSAFPKVDRKALRAVAEHGLARARRVILDTAVGDGWVLDGRSGHAFQSSPTPIAAPAQPDCSDPLEYR